MIAKHELRIGNLITEKSLGMSRIIELRYDHCGVDGIDLAYKCSYEEIEPIPLSPELLVKCGFERMPLSSVTRYRDTATLFFIQTRNKKDWYVYGYKYYPAPIHSLHQLQNLYYSICQNELQIIL